MIFEKSFLYRTTGIAVLLALAPATFAQQVTQTISPTAAPYDANGFRQTNFTDRVTFTFNKFDTSLGTLTSVDAIVSGVIRSGIKIENEDPVARDANATVLGTFFVRRPDNTNIIIAAPEIQTQTVSLGAYDGTTDYMGASAYNFGTLTSATDSEMTSLSSASDIALFSGTGGTITLPVVVNVGGSVNGPGNASINLSSAAAPRVTLRYNYTVTSAAAPEPASTGLLLSVLVPGMVAGVRRRRRR